LLTVPTTWPCPGDKVFPCPGGGPRMPCAADADTGWNAVLTAVPCVGVALRTSTPFCAVLTRGLKKGCIGGADDDGVTPIAWSDA